MKYRSSLKLLKLLDRNSFKHSRFRSIHSDLILYLLFLYPNLCTFQMINCHERKMRKPSPTWLVVLRECPSQPSASVNNEQQFESNFPLNSSNVDENSFVCPETECGIEEDSVCDQEGTVHKNHCEFTRARCLAAKVGRSLHVVPNDECPTNKCRLVNSEPCLTNIDDPVCTTDFRTLPNVCEFEHARCRDPELDILFKGECKQCLKMACPILDESTADESQFLCDQNGETKSRCEFEMVRCIYEIKFGYNVTAAYEGRCCPDFESCPSNSDPVCDIFKREHRNSCYFKVASCRAQKIEHAEPLQVYKNGSCISGRSLIEQVLGTF